MTILKTSMSKNLSYRKLANFHNEKVGGQKLDDTLAEYFKDELRAQHDLSEMDSTILDAIEKKVKSTKVKLSKMEKTKI